MVSASASTASVAVGSKATVCAMTVLALASAAASVLFSDLSVSVPSRLEVPAVMTKPSGIVAREIELWTVMATAPATCTLLPPSPSAEAPLVLPVVPASAPLVVARLLAKVLLSVTFLLTPPSSLPSSVVGASLSLPPATLALALLLLEETLRALKAIAPPALTVRASVATARSVPMLNASEIPTPVSPDSVAPSANVVTEPTWPALTVRSAPSVVLPLASVPRLASVSLLDTEIAITGVTAVAPAAPPSAVVAIAFVDKADKLTSVAPDRLASLPISASVSVSPILSATLAPTPRSPPPDCLPLDLTALSMKFSALTTTFPPPVIVTTVPSRSVAEASLMTTPMARAPATPVAPPLAPAIAVTPKRLSLLASVKLWPLVLPAPVKATRPVVPPAMASSIVVL